MYFIKGVIRGLAMLRSGAMEMMLKKNAMSRDLGFATRIFVSLVMLQELIKVLGHHLKLRRKDQLMRANSKFAAMVQQCKYKER